VNHDKEHLKTITEKIQNLPTINEIGRRIFALASDPEVSMGTLSHAIHQDPSLAARVLKVANSPFYGMSRQVDSLQLALVILGLNEVKNIALGLLLFKAIKKLNGNKSYDRTKFWFHSAACGVICRILGHKLSFRSEGTDFITGLLHDVGKIIIDQYFDSKFVTIFQKTFTHKPPMLIAEREILGESHEQLGRWLAEHWRLPETLCDAIMYHHELPSVETHAPIKDLRLASLSYIAEAFCELYNIGWDGDSGYSDIKDRRAWEILLSHQNAYAPKDIDRILTETLATFSEVRPHLLWL